MGPPRDRLQNLQAQAYFGDDDDYHIPIDEEDNGPMQKFFRDVEDLRNVVDQVKTKTFSKYIIINFVLQLTKRFLTFYYHL